MFQGSIPALTTPFSGERLDSDAFAHLIERQIAAGSGALVVCGTTGEASALTPAEHAQAIELCVAIAAGRVPVIAGVGGGRFGAVVDMLAHAKAVGAHAALAVTPYYVRPSQDGLIAYYRALNEAVQLPIFAYNVPARTGVDLLPETVGEIAKLPNIIGLKDASKALDRVARHRGLCGERFILLSGEDGSAVAFNAQGGSGCISVTANVAPGPCAALQGACRDRDFARAAEIDLRLSALHAVLFGHASPAPTKLALSLLGLCAPDVRLPLTPCPDALVPALRAAMDAAGDLTARS